MTQCVPGALPFGMASKAPYLITHLPRVCINSELNRFNSLLKASARKGNEALVTRKYPFYPLATT